MTIVHAILPQMPGLGHPQRQCLATVGVPILVLRGRVNCRNLRRDGADAERPIARQCREPCDWPDFPPRVLRTALDPRSALVSAHDASCIPQSGKQTCGLGPCCNGGTRRAKRGLEMSPRAVVDVTRRCVVTRAGAQTPPGEQATKAAPDDTRVDCDPQPLHAPRPRLAPRSTSPGVDGS